MSRHLSTDDRVLAALRQQRWVPVLRSADVDDAVATCHALREAGVEVVELTFSTPDVAEAVRRVVGAGQTVGVGTVRTADQVEQVAAAGASFVVSFARPDGFVAAATGIGVTPIPGALTPSEVLAAAEEGAPAVKVFPARLVVPAYLSDLRAVLGDLPLLVTGGVAADPASVRPWLDAGAWCVGIGSPLGTAASVGAAEVTARAAALMRSLT